MTKHDRIGLTKLCLANSPDTGLVYQLTVDSLMIGQKLFLDSPPHKLSEAKQLTGKTFTSRFTRKVVQAGPCYALDLDFSEGERYLESMLLEEILTTENLLERFRYMAGRQLARIGDSYAVRFPQPICFSIPSVVDNFEMALAGFEMRLDGVTLVNGQPCATIALQPHFVKMDIQLAPVDSNYLTIHGMMTRQGEFQVRLSDGDIVAAKIYDRVDGQTWTAEAVADSTASHSYRTITIRQLN